MNLIKLIPITLCIVFSSGKFHAEKYQEWTATQCYHNIYFKIKSERKVGNRHEWQIQFKNGYDQLITFNYGTTEKEGEYLTTNRKTLQPKEVSDPVLIYTQNENFYVLVDKLSFDLYDKDIIPCDSEE